MIRSSRLPLFVALALLLVLVAVRATTDPAAGRAPGANDASSPHAGGPGPVEPALPPPAPGDPRLPTRIVGHVDAGDAGELENLLVRVRPLDPGSDAPALDVRTDAHGRFSAVVPRPGRYRVTIDSYLHATAERHVLVRPGESPILGFGLRRLPGAGDVAGRLVSESGHYRYPVRVTLAPEGRMPLAVRQVVWTAAADGTFVGRFHFEDVPWDDYVVRIWPRPGEVCEWTTLEQRARPPAGDLEFVCLDAAPVAALAFEPFDASTGAPIDDFELCLGFDHGLLPAHCRRGRSGSRFEDVWLNRRLRWSLEAQGYEPAEGDLETWAVDRGVECGLERSFPVPLRPKPPLDDDALLRAPRAPEPGSRSSRALPPA